MSHYYRKARCVHKNTKDKLQVWFRVPNNIFNGKRSISGYAQRATTDAFAPKLSRWTYRSEQKISHDIVKFFIVKIRTVFIMFDRFVGNYCSSIAGGSMRETSVAGQLYIWQHLR